MDVVFILARGGPVFILLLTIVFLVFKRAELKSYFIFSSNGLYIVFTGKTLKVSQGTSGQL